MALASNWIVGREYVQWLGRNLPILPLDSHIVTGSHVRWVVWSKWSLVASNTLVLRHGWVFVVFLKTSEDFVVRHDVFVLIVIDTDFESSMFRSIFCIMEVLVD